MSTVTDVLRRWASGPRPAVIFDFNGTLSDDEPILLDIFTELFTTRLGWAMTPAEYDAELLGLSDREIVRRAVARTGAHTGVVEELLAARRTRYAERVAVRNPITEPAAELVKALSDNGFPLAIVTGAVRADVAAVLAASSIGDLFAAVVTEEDVSRGKPDPEGFLTGADLLGRDPSDILVFEDSGPGVRGALAAGMACVAVSPDPGAELRAVAPVIVPALAPELLSAVLDARR
ncbi:HAD family hydrolase [Mycolicibacterium sp.]|uniref:HAD family hydrolase n=1 Tax=Mycolicibacterium sp. TaxID=2320850 RepID=UPI003D10A9B8